MKPAVQAMAQKYGDKIRFIVADVNTPAGNSLANDYQVMSIPSTFYYNKSGQIVDSFVGSMPETDLEARLKNLIQ